MADEVAEEALEEDAPLTEGAKEALKEELKDFLRELTKFTLWVLALTFVALSSRNSVQMHNAAQFLRTTFNLANGAEGAPSSTGEGFWPYITDATAKINQDDVFSIERPATKFRKLRGIVVFGSQLRQVRVPGGSCTKFYDSVQQATSVKINAPCFGSAGVLSSSSTYTKEWREGFMSDLEASGAVYGDAVKAAFQFSDNGKEQFPTVGDFETYPAGGFIANIPLADAESTQMLGQLQELNWIDTATRAVVWDLLMYNPNTDNFQNLRVLFEFSPSGIMAHTATVSVHNLNLYPMKTFSDFINVGLQGFVLAMLLYYSKEESQEIWAQGFRSYFSSIWNVCDVINILLLIALAIMRVMTFTTANSFLAAFPEVNFGTGIYIMQMMTQQTYIMAVALNLMWVKMLKYLTRHKAFSKLGRTIGMAAPTLAALTIFFVITIIGYSIAYLVIIGVDNNEYADLTAAFWSIVRSLMGDYSYAPVAEANAVLGPLLYWSWQILCQVIFLNLIIAAFCEEFAKILMRDNASKEKTMFDVVGEFDVFKRAQDLLGKRDMLQELEEQLDFLDADDDGLVDEEELKLFLSANKDAAAIFQVDDAAVLVKMFDKDNSGRLDVEEMIALRKFLADKKAKVDMALASAVNGDRSQLEALMQGDAAGAAMKLQINRPGKMGADASRLLGLDADALAHMGEKDDAAAVIMYEGNVKEEQVLKLQGKVEVVVKKVASLLQLLPKLGERFGVTMQQMTQHVAASQKMA